MENSDNLYELFKKYLENECSPGEVKILLSHFEAGVNETILKTLIRQELEKNHQDPRKNDSSWKPLLEETYENIRKEVQKEKKHKGGIKSVLTLIWLRYAAAAAIFTAGAVGVYYVFFNRVSKTEVIVNDKKSPQVQDVAPPANTNAVLTLANGTKIVLDSAKNGALAVQGSIKVLKLADGQISYNGTVDNIDEVKYNMLTVPRGSQVVSLTLSDGTKVWMNAESSLRYPTAFVGNERKVEISGEAYFEVVHLTPRPSPQGGEGGRPTPFIVKKGDTEVEVLGTDFNVNAYDDESNIRVTLVEGSVKVKNANESITIKPGDQAEINKQGKIGLNKNVDVEAVMAWKNGLFVFNYTDLELIMRQIGRWYDVDVQYSGTPAIEKHYSGYMPRLVNLSRVLHMLESAGGVEFTIDGKKIMVKVK